MFSVQYEVHSVSSKSWYLSHLSLPASSQQTAGHQPPQFIDRVLKTLKNLHTLLQNHTDLHKPYKTLTRVAEWPDAIPFYWFAFEDPHSLRVTDPNSIWQKDIPCHNCLLCSLIYILKLPRDTIYFMKSTKLDGAGPVDNRPSTVLHL